ncbi:hypothetical protein WMY93_008531 [Mugilogobius chulae]|uniref:Uncharacterized protein n=1 Tax=Mugilogobius chulae TaxID=88201 RepID=A0AAW0PGG3_9GOBI
MTAEASYCSCGEPRSPLFHTDPVVTTIITRVGNQPTTSAQHIPKAQAYITISYSLPGLVSVLTNSIHQFSMHLNRWHGTATPQQLPPHPATTNQTSRCFVNHVTKIHIQSRPYSKADRCREPRWLSPAACIFLQRIPSAICEGGPCLIAGRPPNQPRSPPADPQRAPPSPQGTGPRLGP